MFFNILKMIKKACVYNSSTKFSHLYVELIDNIQRNKLLTLV